MAFSEYAHFYDLFYAGKNYAAEAEFILELSARFGLVPKTLLDMGCGTGRHLVEFVKRHVKCDGFDKSPEMLVQASRRLSGDNVTLTEANITDFENGKKYDLVVGMFAVFGYLIGNDQLLSGLRTAYKHLLPGGLFIFDGWFGPAVLTQKPEHRKHEYQDGQDTVVRKASPVLDSTNQTVTIHYEIMIKRKNRGLKRIDENHHVRFMFIQEMAIAMEYCNLELIHYCPFMMPDGKLTSGTWNVTFIARRKKEFLESERY